MIIRPILPDEVEFFARVVGRDEHTDDVLRYLNLMFERRAMRSEWCYLFEDDGQPIGGIGLWGMPTLDRPTAFVLWELPWERPDYLAIGQEFLSASLQTLRSLGAKELEYVLDSPPLYPQYQTFPERREQVLESQGFGRIRTTRRFELKPVTPIASRESRLTFHTLDEVGEAAFIEAIERVGEGTFDQRILAERQRVGPTQEARDSFADLQNMEYQPQWWELAYTPENELVGLIMPCRNPGAAVIGYIGVVPEMRGRGYVDDLLARGTATLAASNADRIVADTDVANLPMANAFLRAGYHEFATRREYSIIL